MLERTRATFKLKPHERCPGETFCTEDPRGEIARQSGATLDTHCNAARCHLFYTNPKSTSVEMTGLFEAACVLRERHKTGLQMFESDMPFWAIEAYKTAERIYEQVEAEEIAKSGNDADSDLSIDKGGDTDAFANIERMLAERNGG